jgi:hypothetical protein
MKLYTTIFSLLIGSSALFAQKSINQAGIKITTAPLHCDVPSEGYQADLIALTITNTTNEVKTVSYSFELYYDNNCATCGHDEYLYTNFTTESNLARCLPRPQQHGAHHF